MKKYTFFFLLIALLFFLTPSNQVAGEQEYQGSYHLIIHNYETNQTAVIHSRNTTFFQYDSYGYSDSNSEAVFLDYRYFLRDNFLYNESYLHFERLNLSNYDSEIIPFLELPTAMLFPDISQDELNAMGEYEYFPPVVLPNGSIAYFLSEYVRNNDSTHTLVISQYETNGEIVNQYSHDLVSLSPTFGSSGWRIINENSLNYAVSYNLTNPHEYDYTEAIVFDLMTRSFRSYVYPDPNFFDILFEYNDELYIILGDGETFSVDVALANNTRRTVSEDESINITRRNEIIYHKDKLFVFEKASNQTLNKTMTQISVFNLSTFALEQKFTYTNELIPCNLAEKDMEGHPSFYLRSYYFKDSLKAYKTDDALYMSDDFNLITYNYATETFSSISTKESHFCEKNIKITAIPVNATSEVMIVVEKLTLIDEKSASLHISVVLLAILTYVALYRKRKKKR
ncbi:MAG: hypothetical protein ACXADY_26655 [Candidatus Hodarchaeales archaeon]|jgi:hypothetical protein